LRHRKSILIAACSLTVAWTAAFGQTPPSDVVDEVLAYLGFEASHKQAVLDGKVVFTGMPGMEPLPQAVAVAGAMMIIRRPWTEVVDAYIRGETFRIQVDLIDHGRIPADSDDTSWADGIGYDAHESKEQRRLLKVKPGPTFNLQLNTIGRLRDIPDGDDAEQLATELYREVLARRFRAYRAQGIAGIRSYARGNDREASPATELSAAVESSEFIRKRFPAFYDVLLHYPTSSEGLTESRYYWTKKHVSGRPAFALVHQMLVVGENGALGSETEFYVGHTYNSMLTISGVAPYEGGTLVLAANRTFTEKVTGMGRGLKKSMGREVIAKKFAERFGNLRAKLNPAQD
jgi:hypothetical protein